MDNIETINKLLTEKEQKALAYYQATPDMPAISLDLQARMFEMFLNMKSTDQIQKANPTFQLGQIVSARVQGEWDLKRKEYQDHLFSTVQSRVMQVQMQTVGLVSDMLTVTNDMFAKKLIKYSQTGDEADLGNLKIDSVRQLKEVSELLLQLTGQTGGNTKKVQGTIDVVHSTEGKGDSNKTATSEEASEILKFLAGDK